MEPRSPSALSRRKVLSRISGELSLILWIGTLTMSIFVLMNHGSLRLETPRYLVESLDAPLKSSAGLRTAGKALVDVSLGSSANAREHHKPTTPFDWHDVQLFQNVTGKCGHDKCFWRSVSDPESVGYLVASGKEHYKTMKAAYDFAVHVLEEKCNAKHLYLEEPLLFEIKNDDIIPQLNSLAKKDVSQYAGKLFKKKSSVRKGHGVYSSKDPTLAVQKVRVAPEPHLMFGYMARKWEVLVHKIPEFRDELWTRGISLESIQEKLESERKGIECAMRHSETYFYDLQGLIDLDGNYFHIDVDSQFWGHDKKQLTPQQLFQEKHEMLAAFNEMIQRIVIPPPPGVAELAAEWSDKE